MKSGNSHFFLKKTF